MAVVLRGGGEERVGDEELQKKFEVAERVGCHCLVSTGQCVYGQVSEPERRGGR